VRLRSSNTSTAALLFCASSLYPIASNERYVTSKMSKILTLFNDRNIEQKVDLGKGNTEQGGNQKRTKRTQN